MKNKTIYVSKDDEPVWEEAARFLPFYQRKSLSRYLTEHLRQYLKDEKARQGITD